ncbi:MAG: integrin alpha [Myxococcota bacterium]
MTVRPTSAWLALLPCMAALLGCRPGQFDDLEDRAPIRVYEAPEDFLGRRFGAVVTGFSGELPDGTRVSRVAASGGADSSFAVLPVWTGGVDLGDPVFEGCERASCEDVAEAGAALAGVPVFTSPSNLEEQRMCVLLPVTTLDSPPTQRLRMLCETRTGTFEGIGSALGNIDLGASVVGLETGDPVGFAVLGAPRAAMGTGAVVLMSRDGADAPLETGDVLDLSDAMVSTTAELGADVAAARVDDTRTWIAAAAPGMHRVVVAELTPDGMGGADTTVLGCFDAPAGAPGGFGSDVDLGDVDGDGLPDLAVGADTSAAPASTYVFPGASLGGAAGCTDPDPDDDPATPLAVVSCEGRLDGLREAACADSAFGSRVALGDLTGDGRHELLVAAPFATVEGEAEAGAVYVVPFDAGGGADVDRADVLVHSTPEEGAELGAALATVPSNLEDAPRDEVVAGMPGTDAVGIFLCSALEGDTSDVGRRCIPGD